MQNSIFLFLRNLYKLSRNRNTFLLISKLKLSIASTTVKDNSNTKVTIVQEYISGKGTE